MSLSFNLVNFLLKTLSDYKSKLYIKMRQDNYPMDKILNFLNGYMAVEDLCFHYMDNISCELYGPIDNPIIFEGYTDIMNAFENNVINYINNHCKDNYSGWETLGIKYAICLINCYIKYVIYGDDTEVCDFYLNIPDKNNPNSYEWNERGWDYSFYNDDI